MNVYHMKTKGGYPARDQIVICTDKGRYLKSYDSIVAFIPTEGRRQVGTLYNYSQTTARYVRDFLGMGIPQIRSAIAKEEIELTEIELDEEEV